RFLFSESLSLKGLVEYSGHTADTNATRLPSRDQSPSDAPVLISVTCWASPPWVLISQSWLAPEREDSNRIHFPSGLQRGWRSLFVAAVSCRGGDLPSAVANQK